MRMSNSYTSTSNASALFHAAYPELPCDTRTVWALYVERFPGETDFAQRPFEVVWIADPASFTPCGTCAQCAAAATNTGSCVGIETHLHNALRWNSEFLGQPVALREFDVDDQVDVDDTARHIEDMLRQGWDNDLIEPREDAGDVIDLVSRWDGSTLPLRSTTIAALERGLARFARAAS